MSSYRRKQNSKEINAGEFFLHKMEDILDLQAFLAEQDINNQSLKKRQRTLNKNFFNYELFSV